MSDVSSGDGKGSLFTDNFKSIILSREENQVDVGLFNLSEGKFITSPLGR
jgi:hypothetical protein